MCMLLHRYTVFVILFANGIPFYNSGLVFDHTPPSIYAWTITICIVAELLFLYNGVFLFMCIVVQDESYQSYKTGSRCGIQSRSGRCGKENISCSCRGSNHHSPIVHPVALSLHRLSYPVSYYNSIKREMLQLLRTQW